MNTVYIVDDERIVLDGLVNWVEWSRIDVKVLGTATSGRTAFHDIVCCKPDVVITDIRMPGKDGLELIEEVQKVLPQTVFIVLSGYNEFVYAQRALHYGVVEYLLKPVEEEKILEVVEKALQKRKKPENSEQHPDSINPCPAENQDYNSAVIEKIRGFVNDTLQEPISIQSVADHVNMSPNYITSYFKKYTGMVLSDYILQTKMERAKLLLKNSTLRISQIAGAVGFGDPKYFCKVFKKYTGITASDYRNKKQLTEKQE